MEPVPVVIPGPQPTAEAVVKIEPNAAVASNANLPSGLSGRGRVMIHGSNDATVSRHRSGTTAVTRPDPTRRADIAESAIEPLIPLEPPMSMARPNSPL